MTSPRSNDKGAETISAPAENRVLIDFLSWSLKVNDPIDALKMSGFDVNLFTQCDIGGNGYRKSYRYGNIVCFYDGNDGMGCHISMSGQGCRQFEQLDGSAHCWEYLLHDLFAHEANFARIDIAMDNVDGRLSLPRIRQAVATKSVRSRFKRYRKNMEGTLSRNSQERDSETIYFGSLSSRICIRFYDKAAEQEKKNDLPPGSLGHWVRCELVIRKERAQEAVKHILNGVDVPKLACSALNNYVSIVKVTSENLSQCKMRRWWAAWLSTTEKLKLTTQKAQKFVLDIMMHVERQYSASFAMIKKYLGSARFVDFMHGLIEDGRDKLGKKHDLIIAASRAPALDLPF
ncbi:replication initiation factor domain-containing protein [Oryzomonas japonica]|uniref:Replication initiation factor domain-containing protein n=1 Tax=Oryzomonas japonica TaxID=2603858 RepID=A0A7J4ZTY1_9BACT|nr:replication initiation factor domain-containing protein [Oryzomonas japonica]KAB0666803.1 replication initiation factor domain-containing protein [Oryzomonas japonica]